MMYAQINSNGVVELRQDASEVVPSGAVELTDQQHADLMAMGSDDRITAVNALLEAQP